MFCINRVPGIHMPFLKIICVIHTCRSQRKEPCVTFKCSTPPSPYLLSGLRLWPQQPFILCTLFTVCHKSYGTRRRRWERYIMFHMSIIGRFYWAEMQNCVHPDFFRPDLCSFLRFAGRINDPSHGKVWLVCDSLNLSWSSFKPLSSELIFWKVNWTEHHTCPPTGGEHLEHFD